jgi:hypothetical protein
MKHIKLYEDFINEAIDLNSAKDYLEKRGHEFQEQKNDYVEFYSEEHDANIFVYKNGDVEIHSAADSSYYQKIKKVEDLYDVISEFGDWYEETMNESKSHKHNIGDYVKFKDDKARIENVYHTGNGKPMYTIGSSKYGTFDIEAEDVD